MEGQLSVAVFNGRMENLEKLIATQFDAIDARLGETNERLAAINGTVRKHDREIGVLDERSKTSNDRIDDVAAEARRHGGRQGGKTGGAWGALGGIVGGFLASFVKP